MKNKSLSFKRFILVALLAIIMPCFLFLGGCFGNDQVSVTSIKKTGENGTTVTYTITYSDGTTSTMTIENGKDVISNITINDVYQAYLDKFGYTDTTDRFDEFLKVYLNDYVVPSATQTQKNIYSTLNSVVSIFTAYSVPMDGGYHYSVSGGSGVIYTMNETSDESYIITNCHVVTCKESTMLYNRDEGTQEVNTYRLPCEIMVVQYGYDVADGLYSASNIPQSMTTRNGTSLYQTYQFNGGIDATCVAYSNSHDLAILKVSTAALKEKNPDACPATFATGYRPLEETYLVGNAELDGISITKGQISYYSQNVEVTMPLDNAKHVYRCMRIDNAGYGGNSGGAVFNTKGELIGIFNAGKVDFDNFGFALPIDMVKPCVELLMDKYNASVLSYYNTLPVITMKYAGATLKDTNANFNEETGLLSYDVEITDLYEDGVMKAAHAQVGDIIKQIKIDGNATTIKQAFMLDDALLNVRTNSQVLIKVDREGIEDELDISSYINQMLNKLHS